MYKFGWLCEPAGWDTCFLVTAPRRVFPLPKLTPSSHYVSWGRAADLGRMPRAACRRAHATWLGSSGVPKKGWLSTPPPKSTCGTQMHAGRAGNPWTCCTSSCPDRSKGGFVHVMKTWLPFPALPGDWFGPRQWKRSVFLVIWWESPLLLAPWFLSRQWERFGRNQEDPRHLGKQPLRWERLESFVYSSCSLSSLWLCGRRGKTCFPCSKQQQKKHLKMVTGADQKSVTWNSLETAPPPPLPQRECHTGRWCWERMTSLLHSFNVTLSLP